MVFLLGRELRDSTIVCARNGSSAAPVSVIFLTELGDLPPLRVVGDVTLRAAGGSVVVSEAVKGSKLNSECSARGVCQDATGTVKYLSSLSDLLRWSFVLLFSFLFSPIFFLYICANLFFNWLKFDWKVNDFSSLCFGDHALDR